MITKDKDYKFTFFNKEIHVNEITTGQYIKLLEWKTDVFLEIFWKNVWLMCERQIKNAIQILTSKDEQNILETALKRWHVKKKSWMEANHFYVLEWIMMRVLHQSRTELRTWNFKYFIKMYETLDVVCWNKAYDDFRNHDKPDKKGLKGLLDN